MGNMVEIKVPDIGDFKDVEVIEVLVKPGDRVKPEQALITVESDKASMEIPSPMAGVVRDLRVKIGDKVWEGSPILELEPSDEAASVRAPAAPADAAAKAAPAPAAASVAAAAASAAAALAEVVPPPAVASPAPAVAAPASAVAKTGSPPSTAFAVEM